MRRIDCSTPKRRKQRPRLTAVIRRALLVGLAAAALPFSTGTAEPPAVKPPVHMALPPIGEEVPLPKIKQICEFYGLKKLWLKIERDPPIRPFKSDGCTGWFQEWDGVSLYPAGFLHDLKYWAGYPGEHVARLEADAELMIDVARLLNSTEMAETMFHGVRIGGHENLNAPFSWGFGRRPIDTKPSPPPPVENKSPPSN